MTINNKEVKKMKKKINKKDIVKEVLENKVLRKNLAM